jgi:hypothetical protein
MKIEEAISQVRSILRLMEDSFVTDRTVWSLVMLYAKTVMKRKDKLGPTWKMELSFKPTECLETEEVDKSECMGLVKLRRTVMTIPRPMEGPAGPLIKAVSSIDNSIEMTRTNPTTYAAMTRSSSFKWNKTKYYWYERDRLWFPNVDWEQITVYGIFEEDPNRGDCTRMQDSDVPFPDFIMGEVQRLVKSDFMITAQIPVDQAIADKMNVLRQ